MFRYTFYHVFAIHSLMLIFLQVSILNDAKILQHKKILETFAGVECNLEFVAKEVKYHNSCRNNFHNESRKKKASLEKQEQSERTLKTGIREKAFAAATQFVEEHILKEEEVHKARDVADHHRMLQAEFGLEPKDISRDRDYVFFAKLAEHFEGKIVIMKHETKGVGKIIFSSTIDPIKAFATVFDVNNGISYKVRVMFYL